MKTALLALTSALALLACSTSDGGARGSSTSPSALPPGVLLRLDLDGVAEGALPSGWTLAETRSAGTPATWSVRAVEGGGRALHVATPNAGSTYNLLLSPASYPVDLELSVRVRADSGEEDQGGGLVWRAQGPDDYYIARWNPLEDNLRVYKVEGGVRTLLQSAETKAAAAAWHDLAVAMVGDRVTVLLDGVTLLDTTDATFAQAGRVGLWTKADAATWFAELTVREPRWPD